MSGYNQSGSNNNNYKGPGNRGYSADHKAADSTRGSKCANCGSTQNLESAEIHGTNGKQHKTLCKSCHAKYDNAVTNTKTSAFLGMAKLAAKLSAKQRKAIPASEFVFPQERAFPIEDKAHAEAAVRLAGRVSPEKEKKVDAAVKAKYPEIEINKQSGRLLDAINNFVNPDPDAAAKATQAAAQLNKEMGPSALPPTAKLTQKQLAAMPTIEQKQQVNDAMLKMKMFQNNPALVQAMEQTGLGMTINPSNGAIVIAPMSGIPLAEQTNPNQPSEIIPDITKNIANILSKKQLNNTVTEQLGKMILK